MLTFFGLGLLTCLACFVFVIVASVFYTLLDEFIHKIVNKFCNDKEDEEEGKES